MPILKKLKKNKKTEKKSDSKKDEKKKLSEKKDDSGVLTSSQAYEIIIQPLVTEKSTQQEADGRYTFLVKRSANKIEIKKAVNTIYNVMPEKVRTMNYEGKEKRFGRIPGRRNDWKKAIVQLPEGKSITVHEGV